MIDDVEDKIGKLEAKKDKEGWEMDVLKNWKDKLVKYKEELKKLESNKTTVSELKTRIKEIIKSSVNEVQTDKYGSHLEPQFKKGDKVTYLGYPGVIKGINKEMTGVYTYDVSYDKGHGSTTTSNIYNKGFKDIKKA